MARARRTAAWPACPGWVTWSTSKISCDPAASWSWPPKRAPASLTQSRGSWPSGSPSLADRSPAPGRCSIWARSWSCPRCTPTTTSPARRASWGPWSLQRSQLAGGLYRLPLHTAAGGEPVLKSERWLAWAAGWLRSVHARALIVDTATAGSNVDPWGPDLLAVFRNLRGMVESYPELAILLVVHLKKPQGRGERRLSDVLGEWGRWSDVVLLMENDGASLDRVKLTLRKRVKRERRIVATKRDGLLVDPQELESGGPKVPTADVVAAIAASPGIDAKALGQVLGVSKVTASRYAAQAEQDGQVRHDGGGARGAFRYFAGEESEAELLAQVPA